MVKDHNQIFLIRLLDFREVALLFAVFSFARPSELRRTAAGKMAGSRGVTPCTQGVEGDSRVRVPLQFKPLKLFMMESIKLYQKWLSPLLPRRCRFYPTCSSYMLQAIERHGTLKGVWLGVKRICKCHPLHPGGVDFPPL